MRKFVGVLARLLVPVLIFAGAIATPAMAQDKAKESSVAGPEYIVPGTRPGKGLAPGMKVADLGKGSRTFRVNFVKGDEIMAGLTEFAEKYRIRNGHFTALGALSKATFGWANAERRELGQKKIELNEGGEIISLMGNISMDDQGRSIVHGHGAVALSDGSVKGGHWWEAHVSIVAVVFVTEEEAAPTSPK